MVLQRSRIEAGEDLDLILLTIPVQASHPLMHAHGVPGHIHMDEGVAASLEIDAFASCLCRNQKAQVSGIEKIGLIRSRCRDGLGFPGLGKYPLKAIVPIDEARAAVPVDLIQGGDQQGLGGFVFREEEHAALCQVTLQGLEDHVDLRLIRDLVSQSDEFFQEGALVLDDGDFIAEFRDLFFQAAQDIQIHILLARHLLQDFLLPVNFDHIGREPVQSLGQGLPDGGDRA